MPRIDSVDGMIMAPPMPMKARVAISMSASPGEGRSQRAEPKTTRPAVSIPLRPIAVGERAGAEEQAGEHQLVAVDDPLQLRRRRVEIRDKGGEGDVEHGVVQGDEHQAQAQDGQCPPAAGVVLAEDHWGSQWPGPLLFVISRTILVRRSSHK